MGRTDPTDRLPALLSIARVARTQPRSEALPRIAELLAEAVGFETVIINLYRAAWDDFEVVAVHGSEPAREVLLGRTESRDAWLGMLDDAYLDRGTHFRRRGPDPPEDDGMAVHVPDLPVSADPDRWHPEDLLFVALRDSAGELLGVISVDLPTDGRRPEPADLDLLALAAAHLAESLEQCETAAAASRSQLAIQELLRVSATLSRSHSLEEVLTAVCDGIASALGFERVVALLADGDGVVRPRAASRWADRAGAASPPCTLDDLEPLVAGEHLRHGCALLDAPTSRRLAPPELGRQRSSSRNGFGPHAWCDHRLFVPLTDPDGTLIGAISVDEPVDRLLPSDDRLRALRLFADQAASAVEVVSRLVELRELADRDALTGLANRRALRAFLRRRFDTGLAMLACDLDHFKAINDRLGHQAGDDILVRFAELLAGVGRPSDLAVRLGGEEFALILPGADGATALEVAERMRDRMRSEFAEVPGGVSVSIGVAAADPSASLSVHELIGEADRALYAAKRTGRDRSVLAPAAAPPPRLRRVV